MSKLEEASREKLAVLERTTDGFEIAETDFRLRGPGDVSRNRADRTASAEARRPSSATRK